MASSGHKAVVLVGYDEDRRPPVETVPLVTEAMRKSEPHRAAPEAG